jgi:hypothetical protein
MKEATKPGVSHTIPTVNSTHATKAEQLAWLLIYGLDNQYIMV